MEASNILLHHRTSTAEITDKASEYIKAIPFQRT